MQDYPRQIADKLTNGLISMAMFDAIGDKFEFRKNLKFIDVLDYIKTIKVLEFTDDTQMALFMFEELLKLDLVNCTKSEVETALKKAYTNWYITQEPPSGYVLPKEGLLSNKTMYKVKAPGLTCLESCRNIMNNQPVVNDSKGCGSVMRLLPMLMFVPYRTREEVVEFAKLSGSLTHGHEENDKAIELFIDIATNSPNLGDLNDKVDSCSDISELGEGWTALECVEMAYYAVRKGGTDNTMVALLAITHDGDSDSVAAVAGALGGYLLNFRVNYLRGVSNIDDSVFDNVYTIQRKILDKIK